MRWYIPTTNVVLQGMVGFGLIPSNFTDSIGDTFGGVGSAIAIKRGTWKKLSNGSYTGTLYVQPDRGYNVCVSLISLSTHTLTVI